MNVAELNTALESGESGTTFTWSPSNPAFSGAAWSGITTFVAGSLGGNQLVVTGFTKSVTSAVVYSGTVNALFAQNAAFTQLALPVTATFWLDASQNPQLAIDVTQLPAAYTLAQSFGSFANTVLAEVTFTSPSFVLSSAAGTNPINGNELVQGITFDATVQLTGVLLPVATLLTLAGATKIGGLIVAPPNQYPTMNLAAATLQNTSMPPFPFSAGIGVVLASSIVSHQNGTATVESLIVTASLGGNITLGTGGNAIVIPVSMDLESSNPSFLTLEIEDVSIAIPSWASLQALTGVADLGSDIPAQVPAAGSLQLQQLAVVIDPTAGAQSLVQSLNLKIALNPASPWQVLPNGILSIANLAARFVVDPSGNVGLTLAGTFRFGVVDDEIDYQLSVTVPDLVIEGRLIQTCPISLSILLQQFIKNVTGANWVLPDMDVIQLDLLAAPLQRLYSIEAAIDFGWTLALQYVSLTFETLTFEVTYDGAQLGGNITGDFSITTTAPPATISLYAAASTPGDGSWHLEAGSVAGTSVNLTALLKALLSPVINPTSYSLPNVSITGLLGTIDYTTDVQGNTAVSAWSFAAQTDGFWTFTLAGYTFGIAASVALSATNSQGTWSSSGTITGALMIGNFLATVNYTFTPTNWVLTFQILYKGKGITGQIVQKTIGTTTNTLLTLSLGDLSFGDIVEYLLGLIRPGGDATLSAPWSILYQLTFSGLSLLVNLTTREVGIRYEPGVDLGFVTVDAIELWNVSGANGEGTIQISIEGQFLGIDYTNDPLTWDLLDESPPSVPGKGENLFDVRYVALGQRIGVPAAASADSVLAAIAALANAMKPANPNDNPLASSSLLQFDASSTILFAADFSILGEFIKAGVVLWDPNLYGMYIALGGERAGALSGLEFELLYKKVTADIGVFKIELRVPEAYRQFELGEVSVTLGVVKVDIYTNGNFKVDLGFPKNGDFTNSFAVEVFPFLGFGGFYFALLNGQTSQTVPRISNGSFDPVIEIGLGLSVGVGKEISKGPLQAGISITVYAIIEGTLAWFNPTSESTPAATYFRLEGTAGIVGKLYGSVDFYIIKVSVSVVARASVTFVVESYQPIFLQLDVEVSVEAEITILFVTISFSFSLTINESFTIGSASTPPWLLAPAGGTGGSQPNFVLGAQRRAGRLAANRRRARARSLRPAARRRRFQMSRAELALAPPYVTLNWTNNSVFGGTQKTVTLIATPAFTLALPATLLNPPVDPPPTPQIEGVLLLTAANTISPSAHTVRDVRVVRTEHLADDDPASAPFGILLSATLQWAIAALLGTSATSVTLVDLVEIQRAMALDPNTASTGFSYSSVTSFILQNLVFQITPPPASGATSGTIVPMIPALTMTAPGLSGPVDFSNNTTADAAWMTYLATYFQQIEVDALAGVANDPFESQPVQPPPPPGSPSIATVVFCDWFLLLTRSAVQAAIDAMEGWQYAVQSGDSLQSIAAQFPTEQLTYIVVPGDTMQSVAALFSMTVQQLATLNNLTPTSTLTPGEVLTVTTGVTPETIAFANQALAQLDTQTTLTIDGVLVQVQSGGTLTSIGAPFGSIAADALATQNASSAVLLAGATMQVPSFTHAAIAGDDLDFLAAFYYARNGAVNANDPQYAWYLQAVTELNPSGIGATATVPSGYQAAQSSTLAYTPRPGDTIPLIAAYFFLVQLHSTDLLQSLATAIQNANPNVNFGNLTVGQSITIPAIAHTIVSTDTFASIAANFSLAGVTGSDQVTAAQLGTANASAAILAPLAVIAMPQLSHPIAATDTLASIAAFYNFSIAELAEVIAPQPNAFIASTSTTATTLTIPNVPEQPISTLVTQVLNTSVANTAAASVSRFSACGLRLPYPAGSANTYGLYDLVGQEFPAPPSTGTATIGLSAPGNPAWITFSSTPFSFTLTAAQLAANYPDTTFTPQWISAPADLAFSAAAPVQTSMQSVIHWQAAVQPPFGGPSTPAGGAGEPTIWPFPTPLLEIAAAGGTTPYQLITLPQGSSNDLAQSAVAEFDWATLIPIRLQSITGTGSSPQSSYLVKGADETGRKLLEAIWQHLSTANNESATQLLFLYAPNGASANPAGLASDAIDILNTFLLKTNLSTATTSNAGDFANRGDTPDTPAPLQGDYYAALNAPQQFLTLLWEASVTGTGGYVLNYQTASGAGLPSAVFTQNGAATVWLLVLMGSQIASSNPVRAFYPFNNAAVVGDNLDLTTVGVFAEASDGSITKTVATIAPGNAGFRGTMQNPTPSSGTPTAEQRTQMLFSHLGYNVIAAGNFGASNQGLPAGPAAGTAAKTWSYSQLFNAATLATSHPLPQSPALPSNQGDPYAGISAGSNVSIQLWFLDTFGNETTPSQPIPNVEIPFLYTDDVVGVLSWPGIAASYAVSTGPAITISLQLRWPAYVAGADTGFTGAVLAASAHAARYQQAYYQIQQSDVTATLTTSLDDGNSYPIGKYLLTDVVNGAYAFTTSASQLQQASYTTGSSDTLGAVAATYGLSAAALLAENASLPAASVFATTAVVPSFYTVAFNDTLDSIAATTGIGVPAIVSQNGSAAVPAGVEVFITATTVPVGNNATLASIAAGANCSLGALVTANPTASIEDDVDVTIQNVTVTTSSDTLTTLAAKFATQQLNVTPIQVAQAASGIQNFLQTPQSLNVATTILQEPSTLAGLVALTQNAAVPNLLGTGTALLIGQSNVTPGAAQSVTQFAEEQCRISVAALAAANGPTTLAASANLAIPMQVTIPAAHTLYIPYAASSTDTLTTIANNFTGGNTLTLATINQDVAGIVNGGQSITVSGQQEPTNAGDSFAGVIARFAAAGKTITLPQLVTAIVASTAPLIRPGAFFLVPLPAATAGQTASNAATTFNADIDDFAAVNAAISPLLSPGTGITIGGQTETIGTHDTIAKIVARFAAAGVSATPAQVATAPNVTFSTGSLFFLPPPSQTIVTTLRSNYAFPSPMFPVTVGVTLARNSTLINSEFSGVASVQQSLSTIPPAAQGNTLTLQPFAAAFEAAFTGIKIASSHGGTGQIWLVNFGSTGISQVRLSGGQAAFFAFAPLSTSLQSQAAQISPYTSGSGLGTAVTTQYQGIDLDTWMRDFLAAVDLVLSPPYAVPLFTVPGLAGATNPNSYFEAIVSAKNDVANGLSQNIQPVLQSPAPQGVLADAQTAALQQLLISLSAGYATDAIVQVPAATTTTLPATPAAMLSGPAQPITYTTGATDGFSQIAAYYSVSQNAVASTVANTPGIIAEPRTLTYETRTYQTGPSDTLLTIAAAFNATLDDLVANLQPQSGSGIFAAGVSIPAMGFSAATGAGSTLGAIADYLAVDAGTLAVANENVIGIFSVSSLTIGTTTIQITSANNSIAGAAAAFQAAGLTSMTPFLLGGELRDQSGILTAAVTLSLMRLVPNYTLTSSKVSLTSATSTANFLLTTPIAQDVRSLWLDLEWSVNELEYGITSVTGVQGYEDSSWLSFIIPMSSPATTPAGIGNEIGPINIPIPLRAYPIPPVLQTQLGTPVANATTLNEAMEWNYSFSYLSEEAAQDTLSITATFNDASSLNTDDALALSLSDLLFQPLAQFNAVWPALKTDLALLLDPALPSNATNLTIASVAVQTMATLATAVAAAWDQFNDAARDVTPPPSVVYTYTGRDTFAEVLTPAGPVFSYATFILTAGPSGPGPNGVWPGVARIDSAGIAHPLTAETSPPATQCVYTYNGVVPAGGALTHQLTFSALNLLSFQNAGGGVQITRNMDLIFSPNSTSPPATNGAFIYETPELQFPQPLVPFIVQTALLDINVSGNLTTDLTTMFTTLLGATNNDYNVQLSVQYGYPLVTSTTGTPLNAYVPALFGPIFQYDAAPGTGTVATLVTAINQWQTTNVPSPPPGALWLFQLSIFSSLDPQRLQPLITLTNLQWTI